MGCLVPRSVWLWLLLAWQGSLAFSALPREFSASGDVITRADLSNNYYSTYGSQFAGMQSLEDGRRLQQTEVVQLSSRRDPLRGFRKYEGGLVLHSTEYWVATIWEGWPFLAVAALWILGTFIFIAVRCVCMVKGEGFLPSGRSRSSNRTFKLLSFALLVVQLAALTTFFVYGILVYRAGMDTSKQLKSSYPGLALRAGEISESANGLQGVINGTQLIAGSSMSSAFEPSPPDLAVSSQALVDAIEIGGSVTSSSVEQLEGVYEAVLACVGVAAFVTLMFLLLASGGVVASNRKLMHACLVLLPASSILLWCTGGLLYGVLLHGVDLCNSLSGFLLNPDQQGNSQIRVDLLPCPAAAVSSALTQSTTQALFNLTRAANTIIEDQYSLPEMTAFGNTPLLCESFAVDATGNYTEVACPFPTSQHIYTTDTWEPNTSSLRCNGNNNTLCALSSTPLTQSSYTSTVQLLEQMRTAQFLLDDTEVVGSCDLSSDSAESLWLKACKRDQLQAPLMGAWITCTIAAACGLGLVPLLLLVMRAAAPQAISQVDVVYNPGYNSLPLKSIASGSAGAQTEYMSMATMNTGTTTMHSMGTMETMGMGTMNMGTMGVGGLRTIETAANPAYAFEHSSTMSSGGLLSPPATAGLEGFLTIPDAFLLSHSEPPDGTGGAPAAEQS